MCRNYDYKKKFKSILDSAPNFKQKSTSNQTDENKKRDINKERNLIKLISFLYSNGIFYQDTLKYKNLIKEKLKTKISENKFENFTNYVYTRDVSYFTFGQWYNFSFLDIALMEKFFEKNFNLNGANKFDLKISKKRKLIGLLFAIYLKVKNTDPNLTQFLNELKRKNKIPPDIVIRENDFAFFTKPSDLGKFAGLIGFSRKRNPNDLNQLLNLLNFHSTKVQGGYKSIHLLITGIENFIRNFDDYKDLYKAGDSYQDVNNINDRINDFFNTSFKSVPKKLVDYFNLFEFRFHRKADYFNLKKVRNIPFLRIHYGFHFANFRFFVPRNFINYNHLLNLIFYNFPFSKIPEIDCEIINHNVPKKSIDETFNELIELFKEHNFELLNRQTNDDEFWTEKHFKQIKDAYPIVRQISENGITINNREATETLKKLKQSFFYNRNASDKESLKNLYTKIEEYLNNKGKKSLDDTLMDYFWLDDKIAISEEDNDELYTDDFDKLIKNYFYVLTAFRMDLYSTLDKNSKIYGHFTTHGANSHRMTCKKFNLQGISKNLRNELFIPEKTKGDRILLSADVSGQDIVVAISLAKKYYESTKDVNNVNQCINVINYIKEIYKFNSNNNKRDSSEENNKSSLTTELAKEVNNKLTEFILGREVVNDNTLSLEDQNLLLFFNPKYFEKEKIVLIKKIVKEYIYTNFYGGSYNTILKERKVTWIKYLEEINKLFQSKDLKQINQQSLDLLNKRVKMLVVMSRIYKVKTDEIINAQSLMNLFSSHNKTEVSETTLKDIIKDLRLTDYNMSLELIKNFPNKYEQLDETVIWINNKIYLDLKFKDLLLIALIRGIIDENIMQNKLKILKTFLDHAKDYYETKKMTLPTLLDWQTVIRDPGIKKGYFGTRSKSYPIQASGAELMRQWLIEINKIIDRKRLKRSKKFLIINTIHDQVLVDCDRDFETEAKEILNQSIKKAAKKLGIDKDIISIDIEKKYPKESQDINYYYN